MIMEGDPKITTHESKEDMLFERYKKAMSAQVRLSHEFNAILQACDTIEAQAGAFLDFRQRLDDAMEHTRKAYEEWKEAMREVVRAERSGG